MADEDEDTSGKNSQSKTLKRIRNFKVETSFGSWDPSVWTFSGVIVVAILLLITIMLLLPFGLNPINRRAATVESNSMEPTFQRGDIVFLKDVDPQQIEEGDVIVVQVPDMYREQHGYPPLVTHRVTDIVYDPLFNVGLSENESYLTDEQVERPVPQDLKEEFREENYFLDDHAKMTPASDNVSWIKSGGERQYRLEETDGELTVYDSRPAFRTQGDAEDQADPFLTPPQNVMGEYSGSQIPYLGLLFMFANTPTGMATLTLAFALVVVGVYFPWHIDIKEERSEAMRALGSGFDTVHRRLTEIEDAVGEAAGAVGERASGLMVSRSTEGKIADVKMKSKAETKPENIMMKRGESETEDIGMEVGTPSGGKTPPGEEEEKERERKKEKESKKEIDLRPLDELHKRFQEGDLSVDEFIEMRKEISKEKEEEKEPKGKKEIDLRPLNELDKEFQMGDLSVDDFIEMRKNISPEETEEESESETEEKEIDLRPLNQLHKKFQMGDISVEEFIEKRKELRR